MRRLAARDTLGGAVAVAGSLPGPLGASVLEVARAAFVHGMEVAATISAIIAITVAVLAVVLLRDIRGRPGDDTDADLSDNRATSGDLVQPEPHGTVIPVPEC